MSKQVVLSYGMGVDSTAILLEWINNPASRDFELSDLTVITSMVGNEFEATGRLVREHILPLLREHGIRFVQVAKAGPSIKTDGIVVLDDSTETTELHIDGCFTLSDELRAAATLPTSGGCRKCSLKFKGDVLDGWIGANIEGEFDHVIGFNSEETRRVAKDQCFGKANGRIAKYPLLDWDWDRETCERFIVETLGVEWRKSCCTMCPFAKRHEVVENFEMEPESGGQALALEHVALKFNPRMKLYKTKAAIEIVSDNAEALAAMERELSSRPWAIYEMKRVMLPRETDANKRGATARQIRMLSVQLVTRDEAEAEVEGGVEVVRDTGDGSFPRIEVRRVAAPAWVREKQGVSDETWAAWWAKAEVLLDGSES
jgi:hypothetical protein